MMQRKSFTFQLLIMGGFFFFFYMFFALAISIYHDYKLESEIDTFKNEINSLADLVNQKPYDLKYLESDEYKDRYAKENLNLLNPGEKLIILPGSDQNVEQGPVELMTDILSPDSVLNKPNREQWWEYFFGQTLSVTTTPKNIPDKFFEPKETAPVGEPAES
ncbi:MAG: septum formation initiator family protein [Patescibacteria group bacterium]